MISRVKSRYAVLLLCVLLLFVLSACLIERAVIYKPRNDKLNPADWGLPAQPVALKTPDHETLEAWWIPSPEADSPVLLMFQGRRGLRYWYLNNIKGLWEAGFAVMLFQYRGYGNSTGDPSEEGLIIDGLTALEWLQGRIGSRPVILLGRSLGGAVAAQIAARVKPAGLVLESTFTSIPAMARSFVDFPGVELLVFTDFDTKAAIEGSKVPLMVIHGTADRLVPFAMGRSLYDAAATPTKFFHAVNGGRHWNTFRMAGGQYYQWFRNFMTELDKTPTARPVLVQP